MFTLTFFEILLLEDRLVLALYMERKGYVFIEKPKIWSAFVEIGSKKID